MQKLKTPPKKILNFEIEKCLTYPKNNSEGLKITLLFYPKKCLTYVPVNWSLSSAQLFTPKGWPLLFPLDHPLNCKTIIIETGITKKPIFCLKTWIWFIYLSIIKILTKIKLVQNNNSYLSLLKWFVQLPSFSKESNSANLYQSPQLFHPISKIQTSTHTT